MRRGFLFTGTWREHDLQAGRPGGRWRHSFGSCRGVRVREANRTASSRRILGCRTGEALRRLRFDACQCCSTAISGHGRISANATGSSTRLFGKKRGSFVRPRVQETSQSGYRPEAQGDQSFGPASGKSRGRSHLSRTFKSMLWLRGNGLPS